jgi:hypothetical protein
MGEIIHDAHVEVGMNGCKATRTCGEWTSCPDDVDTSFEKRKSAMNRWYGHYVAAQRAETPA